MSRLLEVKDLRVRFNTPEGIVRAVNGISYHLNEGEVLAVVGESGSGKSVSMMSILGLIPQPPGEIVSGEALYLGRDLLKMPEDELESIRGREIGMIFQDPMTSLNPVLSIERQMTEAMQQHLHTCKSCFSRMEFERLLKGKMTELRDETPTQSMQARVRALLKDF